MRRRAFLAGAAAASAIPAAAWAEVGAPAFLAAAREPSGAFALIGLGPEGGEAFRVPLPARGHAAAAHPLRAEAVAFARRPGTFALVLDCRTGAVRRRLEAPEGRHFYGHGAYLGGGTVLATTENDFAAGEGVLGLWDAHGGYRRMGEWRTGGTGPHEVVRLPGTEVLAVANGGIRTHPATGRRKLNLAVMRPNLAFLRDGAAEEVVELGEGMRLASIRHLAARRDGTVAMALQWQGEEGEARALLALHRRGGGAPRLLEDPATQGAMRGYGGSVAFSGDGARVAVTGPRGGLAQVFPVAGGPAGIVRRPDICGVAPAGAGLAFTDGRGGILHPGGARRAGVAWDNHLVPVGPG